VKSANGSRLDKANSQMTIQKYGRFFAVYDDKAALLCVYVYKKGALEVVRRLNSHCGSEQKALVGDSDRPRCIGPAGEVTEAEIHSQRAFHGVSEEPRCARICSRVSWFLLVLGKSSIR
jgi:hypothetical protein